MKNIELAVGESATFKYRPVDKQGVPIFPVPTISLGLVNGNPQLAAADWEMVKFTGGNTISFTGLRLGISFFSVNAVWTDISGINHTANEIFAVLVESNTKHFAWEEVTPPAPAKVPEAATVVSTETQPVIPPTIPSPAPAPIEPAAGSVGVNP